MESRLLQGGAEGMKGVPKISVAVPVYNEESIVEELLRRVLDVLDSLPGGPHEIVLADDGSSDQTWAMIEQAAARDPRVVGVSLSRNFGHQAAIGAALDHVTGPMKDINKIFFDADYQVFS
jgi:dolichol-phosphate mannosyltransferase